jgi:hypothetical protein
MRFAKRGVLLIFAISVLSGGTAVAHLSSEPVEKGTLGGKIAPLNSATNGAPIRYTGASWKASLFRNAAGARANLIGRFLPHPRTSRR